MLQHFLNYVSTRVNTAKEIFFSISIASNPKCVPRFRGDIHMTSMKISEFLRPPTHFSSYVPFIYLFISTLFSLGLIT